MKPLWKIKVLLYAAIVISIMLACIAEPPDSSEFKGKLYERDGVKPAGNTTIILHPWYSLSNIEKQGTDAGFRCTTYTDENGEFSFRTDKIPDGLYCIEAWDTKRVNCIFIDTFLIESTGNLHTILDTLKPPVSIKGIVPLHDLSTEIHIEVSGLGLFAEVSPEGNFLLNTLPEGNWLLGFSFTYDSMRFFDTIRVILKAGTDTSLSWPDINITSEEKSITFQKVFNWDNWRYDHFIDVFQSTTGGFDIIYSNGYSVHFMKTDRQGDSIWGRKLSSFDSLFEVECVQPTRDGGFILAGSRYGVWEGMDNIDIFLSKFNYSGDIQWTKIFKSRNGAQDQGAFVWQANDGGFIVLGNTVSFDKNENGIFVIKTDCNGDTIWTKRFNAPSYGVGYSVKQTKNDGFIIAGTVQDTTTGSLACLIKTNEIGDIVWVKKFDEFPTYDIIDVQQTGDGGYIFAANGSLYFPTALSYFMIVKTKSNGDILWSKTVESSGANSMEQTSDNGFIVAGSRDVRNIFILKISADGNTLWDRTLNTIYNYRVGDARQTNDGGYIITAKCEAINCIGNTLLIKTDENGMVDSTRWH